ncbi:unnamed protein product [Oikopleura dioica]|uniref:Gap junction protein n=1 Tax=Oikopleura dioica TaxID=34765 RepID=E4XEP0_OIKDI|nr:unnamed protein product [Oikopleura dioica]
MSWHFVERWLQKVNQHSTLIGKFWLTFLIIFRTRIVVVSSVGDRVYSDEQSEFKCNTLQIGCTNVCFNMFSPISHIRFWSFQIILVCTPSIVFMVYRKEDSSRARTTRLAKSLSSCPPSTKSSRTMTTSSIMRKQHLLFRKLDKKTSHLKNAAFFQHFAIYTMSVVLRAAIECAFLLLQYRLFGFRVPELYKCRVDPCPNTVDCYSSRPTEKTIFIHFMFGITLLSMFLNFTELIYLAWHWIARRHRKLRDRQRLAKLQECAQSIFQNL